LKAYPSDILCFQEVKQHKKDAAFLSDYSYVMAPNIESLRYVYGVMTAAKFGFYTIQANLSKHKEAGVLTHKSRLLTHHHCVNGQKVHLMNLHAINFVSLKRFQRELDNLCKELKECDDAIIIGGDFNNWSQQRVKALSVFQKELQLQKAEIEDHQHVKHVFSKPLDHIYYRGVTLQRAVAIDAKKISDHNPIYAVFCVT